MKVKHGWLAAALVTGGMGAAFAQNAATFDPNQVPATQGKVAQYSLSPRGDVDGLILTDGTEVHLPPHLGAQLVFAVKPGDSVTVRGLRARAIPMVQAMSIKNDATGATIVDNAPGGPDGIGTPPQSLSDSGRIKAQLHGPRGDLNGVLLEDGTIVRLPPPEAQRLAATLVPGGTLSVQGRGVEGPLGRVIEARSIGTDTANMAPVNAPPPPPPRPHGGPPPRPHGGPAPSAQMGDAVPPAPPADGPSAIPVAGPGAPATDGTVPPPASAVPPPGDGTTTPPAATQR